MDFSMISSVNSYVKGIELKQKWQKKKEQNNFTPQSQIDFLIEEQRKQAEGIPGTARKNKNISMDAIQTKIVNGKDLTYEEEEYLRHNSPVTLQYYKSAKAERSAYERDLKSCKTKDEVERVKMARISSSLTAISAVSNNSDIPKGIKYQLLSIENQKMNAITKITAKYIQSGAYADLPTDEEKRRAEKELQDALNPQPSENEENTDSTAAPSDIAANAPSDTDANATSDGADSVPSDKQADDRRDMSAAEAFNTPEMQKLKRARARAAYAKTKSDQDSADASPNGGQINISI